MLDMGSGEDIDDVRFKQWPNYPSWGYLRLNSIDEFDEDVKH
jgi:hypothetical protein